MLNGQGVLRHDKKGSDMNKKQVFQYFFYFPLHMNTYQFSLFLELGEDRIVWANLNNYNTFHGIVHPIWLLFVLQPIITKLLWRLCRIDHMKIKSYHHFVSFSFSPPTSNYSGLFCPWHRQNHLFIFIFSNVSKLPLSGSVDHRI